MKQIGTNDLGYPENRNFVDIPHHYRVVKERDLFSLLLNIHFLFFKKVVPVLQFLHFQPWRGTKLKHFFNAISFSNKFIVTYETTLPRLGNAPQWLYRRAVKVLASEKCIQLIAISKCTHAMQHAYIKEYYPQFLTTIEKKTIVLVPPQKPLVSNYESKRLPSEKIIFTIVGKDFFRKGGQEVLTVFNRLIPHYPQLHLNIVSQLAYNDYASRTTLADKQRALEIINAFPRNITHYPSLSNPEVISLLIKTHVGLLPTWGDSYGYSVLESQAAACPVITTNIRALPEINDDSVGWVIDVPKLENGNGILFTPEDRSLFSSIVSGGLESVILEIVNNPSVIREKGLLALERIRQMHNPIHNAKILAEIYSSYV